jgi:hypothetical protein
MRVITTIKNIAMYDKIGKNCIKLILLFFIIVFKNKKFIINNKINNKIKNK